MSSFNNFVMCCIFVLLRGGEESASGVQVECAS
jgi:hypothetical protein